MTSDGRFALTEQCLLRNDDGTCSQSTFEVLGREKHLPVDASDVIEQEMTSMCLSMQQFDPITFDRQ